MLIYLELPLALVLVVVRLLRPRRERLVDGLLLSTITALDRLHEGVGLLPAQALGLHLLVELLHHVLAALHDHGHALVLHVLHHALRIQQSLLLPVELEVFPCFDRLPFLAAPRRRLATQ